MGRPKVEDLPDVDDRLLTVGAQLFYSKGYGATTMSEVCKEARVSKTTLYARYPSKAALFRAMVAKQIESWETGFHRTPIDTSGPIDEILRVYGDILLRAGMTRDFIQIHRLMNSESERFPELGEMAAARFLRGVQYIAEQIESHAERDGISCRNPDQTADLFLSMLTGWTSSHVVSNRTVTDKERIAWLEEAVRMFMAARSAW